MIASPSFLSSPAFFFYRFAYLRALHSFPTRRSSDLVAERFFDGVQLPGALPIVGATAVLIGAALVASLMPAARARSEEHTSELQSLAYLVCRLLLEKHTPRELIDRGANPRIFLQATA